MTHRGPFQPLPFCDSGVSPEWSRGAESPPSTCCPVCWGCSPGYSWHITGTGLGAENITAIWGQTKGFFNLVWTSGEVKEKWGK